LKSAAGNSLEKWRKNLTRNCPNNLVLKSGGRFTGAVYSSAHVISYKKYIYITNY
jgi:hypothetical protein